MFSFFSHFRSVCMLLVFVAAATSASSKGETMQDSLLTHFSLAVYDYDTGAPLDSAKIQIHSFTNSFDVCTNQEGEVAFDLCCDSLVSLDISYENYIGLGDIVKIEDTNRQIRREYFMKEIFCGPPVMWHSGLIFECNSAEKFESENGSEKSQLQYLVELCSNNPTLVFKLDANLSTKEFEQGEALGLARINFCRDRLISAGVDQRRLIIGDVKEIPCSSSIESSPPINSCCEEKHRIVLLSIISANFNAE